MTPYIFATYYGDSREDLERWLRASPGWNKGGYSPLMNRQEHVFKNVPKEYVSMYSEMAILLGHRDVMFETILIDDAR